jgi:hypothetical protein
MPIAAFLATLLSTGTPALPGTLPDRWLQVDPFRSSTTPVTSVSLFGGDPLGHPEQLGGHPRAAIGRFELRVPKGSDSMLDQLRDDSLWLVRIDMKHMELGDDSYFVALDELPVAIELTAQDFESYLRQEGLVAISAQRAKQGHAKALGELRHSRHLKSIFQRGSVVDDFVSMPIGQDLELVTLKNPYGLRAGSTLPVLLLFHGQPLAGHRVTAVKLIAGKPVARSANTDPLGRVSFVLDGDGVWLLRAAQIEPSKEPDVDWRSYGASLTFSLGK